MSITCNVFTINQVYDLINDGQWVTYDPSGEPVSLYHSIKMF